jgi:hypothetical protein
MLDFYNYFCTSILASRTENVRWNFIWSHLIITTSACSRRDGELCNNEFASIDLTYRMKESWKSFMFKLVISRNEESLSYSRSLKNINDTSVRSKIRQDCLNKGHSFINDWIMLILLKFMFFCINKLIRVKSWWVTK